MVKALKPELNKIFKPAFLGRLVIIPYFPIRDESLKLIVRLKLAKIQRRLHETHKIGLTHDEKLIEEVVRRTRMLNMGTQSLLLTGGIPLDIDVLLGRGAGLSAAATGKTRLSVVYLNTLGSEREKQFFVGQLAQALR